MLLNFFGHEFEAWKLHSFRDYAFFFVYILFGVAIFYLIMRRMNKHRTAEHANRRVMKKLRRLAKKPSLIAGNATLHLPDGDMTFDIVLADKSGIFLIKTYGWGLKVYGTPDGETWRREDQRRKEEFPNPLFDLKKGSVQLSQVLAEHGYPRVRIMPMVVFADNFDTAELYLGYGSFSTTIQEMKKWYRKQAGVSKVQYDFDGVTAVLKGIMSAPES